MNLKEMSDKDEIIVIDNGSTDDTTNIVNKYEKVILITKPKATIAGLRNTGAELSRGDLLAFVDGDCLICKGWRKAVINVMQDNRVGATGSLCDTPNSSTWVERAWCSLRYLSKRTENYIPSANFIVRRSVFEKINGFNNKLITDEDTEICYKIRKENLLIIEEPEARAIHLRNAKTIKEFIYKELWHATSVSKTMFLGKLDKSVIMTACYILVVLLIIPLTIITIHYKVKHMLLFVIDILLINLISLITVIYRAIQYKNYRYSLHLMILYNIFYCVRAISMIKNMITMLIR